MMGGCDELREDVKRRIEVMQQYCTRGSRMDKLLRIVTEGLSYKKATAIVPDLDWDTYRFFVKIRTGDDAQPQHGECMGFRKNLQEDAFSMIRDGFTIEDMIEALRIDRCTVHMYITRYVKRFGVSRDTLACVQAEACRAKPVKQNVRVALIRARQAAGYTIEQVAALLGLHRNHYARIESGRKNTIAANWAALSELLGVDEAELRQQTEIIVPYRRKISMHLAELDEQGGIG